MQSIIKKSVLGALVGTSLMVAAGVVGAAPNCVALPDGERVEAKVCQAYFLNLYTAIGSADFSGRNADDARTCLLAKTDNAVAKTNLSKIGDAIQKLGDIQSNVGKLGAEKLDPSDKQDIENAAQWTIECLRPYQ